MCKRKIFDFLLVTVILELKLFAPENITLKAINKEFICMYIYIYKYIHRARTTLAGILVYQFKAYIQYIHTSCFDIACGVEGGLGLLSIEFRPASVT